MILQKQKLYLNLHFLDKLPKKKITLAKVDATPVVDKTKVYLVDVPKGAQTEFRVGYTTGLKYDATGDYYKAYLSQLCIRRRFQQPFES